MHYTPITVILTTHNKGAYVLNALESIRQQTLDQELFEVLVVGDQDYDDLETKINEYKYRYIKTKDQSFHGKIRTGVLESKGEILTFLEDDDLYSNDRLETIFRVFAESSDLTYYHNSHIPINNQGEKLQKTLYSNPGKSFVIMPGNDYKEQLKEISTYSPDFNTSSMAIKRSIFLDAIEYFDKTTAAVDNFIFYCSARVEGKMIIDSHKLTFYRIHPSQTLKNEEYETFMKKRDSKAYNLFASYRVISEMTKDTAAEELWTEEFLIFKSHFGIFEAANGDKRFLPEPLETFLLFKNAIMTKRKFLFLLVIWIYLFRFAPRLFRYPYYRYKMWELSRVSDQFS